MERAILVVLIVGLLILSVYLLQRFWRQLAPGYRRLAATLRYWKEIERKQEQHWAEMRKRRDDFGS